MRRTTKGLPNTPFAKLKWGFIYLLRLGEKYKIGTTVNLRSRVKGINGYLVRHGDSTVTVEHYFLAEDGYKTERQFHDYFADKRTKSPTAGQSGWTGRHGTLKSNQSEWYALSKEEVEYIKSFDNEV